MSADPILICLPPAGAGPSLFRDWMRDDARVIAPGLPGREARFREAAPNGLAALADLLAAELAAEIAPQSPAPYAIFGYSMGGTLGYLIAERLVARGLPQPLGLVLLGATAPDRLAARTGAIHARDSAGFWEDIARIGGTPAEILADADLRALFEPALRQDFARCADYRHEDRGFRLSAPIHAFVAAQDHLVGVASATDWAGFSRAGCRLHRIEGKHMLDAAALRALRAPIRRLIGCPAQVAV